MYSRHLHGKLSYILCPKYEGKNKQANSIDIDGACVFTTPTIACGCQYISRYYKYIYRGRGTREFTFHSAQHTPHIHHLFEILFRISDAYYVIACASSPLFRTEHPFKFSQFQLSVAGFLPLGRRRRFFPSSSFTHTHTHTRTLPHKHAEKRVFRIRTYKYACVRYICRPLPLPQHTLRMYVCVPNAERQTSTDIL